MLSLDGSGVTQSSHIGTHPIYFCPYLYYSLLFPHLHPSHLHLCGHQHFTCAPPPQQILPVNTSTQGFPPQANLPPPTHAHPVLRHSHIRLSPHSITSFTLSKLPGHYYTSVFPSRCIVFVMYNSHTQPEALPCTVASKSPHPLELNQYRTKMR